MSRREESRSLVMKWLRTKWWLLLIPLAGIALKLKFC